ncbi:MAG: hypothetical protein WC516_09770 [Patescibacteria group bacterium]|jgi:hypothetical protein
MENQYKIQDAKLTGRNIQSRKIANNTYLQRRDSDIVVKLHDTDIITYKSNGDIVLNSGGWHTMTTKDRLNNNLPRELYISQNKGIWYIKNLRYKDGLTIKASGKILNYDKTSNDSKDNKLKAKIKAYAKLCSSKIPLDLPNGGDCWYCYMQTNDGKSLGDNFKDKEHLLSHIKENYIVPSLVYNALKERYNAPMAFSYAFKSEHDLSGYLLDYGKQAVYKAVYKYILSRLGYAV